MNQAAALASACPVCGEDPSQILFTRRQEHFAECRACGLIFQCAPPSAEESRAFYQEDYYDSLAEIMPDLLKARVSIYRGLLDEAQAWKQTGRMLDVGCGHGDFLRMATREGWEGWGIEPSQEAAQAAEKIPGLKIFCGTAENTDFPENHFDVITLWNVLDCLPDPRAALKRIHGWLRPGGLLWVRTPNADFHLFIFRTQQKLKSLLEKIGWKKDASVFLRSNFRGAVLRRLLAESGFNQHTVQNGHLTQGDPYGVVSGGGRMQALKNTLFETAKIVEWLSNGRVLIGAVLLARAVKEPVEILLKSAEEERRVGIKKIGLHALAVLGYCAGLPLWRRLFGGETEIRILTYHSIHPAGNDLSVRPADFEKQAEFMKAHYDILPLEQAMDMLERGRLPLRPSVALTFDDGFLDNARYLLPLLTSQKIPVTVFQLTGKERRASYLRGAPPLMEIENIRDLSEKGVDFGSHGESHRRLTQLSPEEALGEMKQSKAKLEAWTGRPVSFFAYPYGRLNDFDAGTQALAREAGYRAACSALYGTNGPESGRFALKRIGIEAADTLFTVRAKLNGALDGLALLDLPFFRRALKALSRGETLEDPMLLVSVDFPPYQNGVSTISGHLSRELARQKGRNFCVIAPQISGGEAYDQAENYRVWRYPGNELGWWRFFAVFFYMPWVLFKYRIRKVLAMNVAYGGVTAWLLSCLTKLDYVVFAYGYEFEKFKNISWARSFYLKIYARARKVIVCSAEVGQRLERFGVSGEKIEVAYPAVDTFRYFPLEEEKKEAFLKQKNLVGRRGVLSAGRLVERKGHDQVLRALGRVKQDFPEVLYLIAGSGPAEDSLQTLAGELGLREFVRFLGRVSDEDLNGYYNACEFFIMPSREIPEEGHVEGFGIVYLEANACTKPGIGGRSGGVAEAIQEGKTGLLADPQSIEDIADKMLFFLSHPEEARKMGEQGLARLRREFSWPRYAEIAKRYL